MFSFQSISFALLLLNLLLSILFDAVINGIVSCFLFMLYIHQGSFATQLQFLFILELTVREQSSAGLVVREKRRWQHCDGS